MCKGNVRKKERERERREEIFETVITENSPKLTQSPKGQKTPKRTKARTAKTTSKISPQKQKQNNPTLTYHIQTAKNQR